MAKEQYQAADPPVEDVQTPSIPSTKASSSVQPLVNLERALIVLPSSEPMAVNIEGIASPISQYRKSTSLYEEVDMLSKQKI